MQIIIRAKRVFGMEVVLVRCKINLFNLYFHEFLLMLIFEHFLRRNSSEAFYPDIYYIAKCQINEKVF